MVDWKGSYIYFDILGLKSATLSWSNVSSGLGNKQGDIYGFLFLTDIVSK